MASNEDRIAKIEAILKLAEQLPDDPEVQADVVETFRALTPRDRVERVDFLNQAREKFAINTDVAAGSPRHKLLDSLQAEVESESSRQEPVRAPVPWGETFGRSFVEGSVPGASYAIGRGTDIERQTGVKNPAIGTGSSNFTSPEGMRPFVENQTGQPVDAAAADAAGQVERRNTALAAADHPSANFLGQIAALLGLGKVVGPVASLPGKAALGAGMAAKGAAGAASVEGQSPADVATSAGIAAPFGAAGGMVPAFGAGGANILKAGAAGAGLAAGEEAVRSEVQDAPFNWLNVALGGGLGATPSAAGTVSRAIENPLKPTGATIARAREIGHEPGPWGPRAPDVATTSDALALPSKSREAGQTRKMVPAGSEPAFAAEDARVTSLFLDDIENINSRLRKRFSAAEDQAKNLVGAKQIDAAPLVREYDDQIERLSRSGAPEIQELRNRRKALMDQIEVNRVTKVAPGVEGHESFKADVPAHISLAELIEHRKELDRTSSAGKIGGRGDYPFRSVAAKAREMVSDATVGMPYHEELKKAHERMLKTAEINDNLMATPKTELEVTGAKERAAMGRIGSVGRTGGIDQAAGQGKTNSDVFKAADDLEDLAAEVRQTDPSFQLSSGGRRGINQVMGQRAINDLQFGTPSITASAGGATVRSGIDNYWMPFQARVVNPVARQVEDTAPLPLLFGVGSEAETGLTEQEIERRRRVEEIQRLESQLPMAGAQ